MYIGAFSVVKFPPGVHKKYAPMAKKWVKMYRQRQILDIRAVKNARLCIFSKQSDLEVLSRKLISNEAKNSSFFCIFVSLPSRGILSLYVILYSSVV